MERIGSARLICANFADAPAPLRVGHLTELEIAPDWRGRGIGKWLLWRLINDATLQGVQELIAFVAQNWGPAITLLTQQGFQELNYRGYAFEKDLDE
jgi:ribosomal protein S18 acetylase RimI-like enzyme